MSYLVQLADEQDNFLGYKQRDALTDDDTWRVVAVDIYDLTGEYVLIQKRSMQKRLEPWKWTVAAAGTLEENDTYESCAPREIEEEIGVTGCQLEPRGRTFRKSRSLGYRQLMLYTTRISIDTPLIIQESEVDEVRWISRTDLKAWVEVTPDDFTESTLETWRSLGVV